MHETMHEARGMAVARMGESWAGKRDENRYKRGNARNAEDH
jgi:hypothetical protein